MAPAPESKLSFKRKVFRLTGNSYQFDPQYNNDPKFSAENNFQEEQEQEQEQEEPFISADDPYWETFWKDPQSAEDIFNLLTYSDIKIIRDSNRPNFLNLVRLITIKLIQLATDSSFPDPSCEDKKYLLNCVRVLNRVLPFLFEKQDLRDDIKSIFWNLAYNNVDFANKDNNNVNSDSAISNVASVSTESSNDSSLSASSLKVNVNVKVNKSPNSTKANVGANKYNKPLGHQLIITLVDLLFTMEFTLEKSPNPKIKGVDFKIWEAGIGSNGKYTAPNVELDSNRLEILRLIITLSSQGLYTTAKQIVSTGSRFLTVLVSTIPRLKFLTLICSLLNLVCRSCKNDSEDNGLTYNSPQYAKYNKLRTGTITYSLQLLTIMLVYPLPSNDLKFLFDLDILPDSEKPHNLVRSYLGRLHKENELSFIYASLFNLLKKPIDTAAEDEFNPFSMLKNNAFTQSITGASSQNSNQNYSRSLNPVSQLSSSSSFPSLSPWSTEIVILIWELIQCNKNFKKFVYTKKSHELTVTLFYYIKFYKNADLWKSNLIRVITYFFLYLISDELALNTLLLPFNSTYYSKLPQFFKINIPNQLSNLTYRDFLIIQISNILINDEFDVILSPNFFEYLYNLIPIKNLDQTNQVKSVLSYHSCLALVNLISKYSSTESLADNLKLDLLALIVRAIAHSICRYQKDSRTLLYIITKHEKVLVTLLENIKAAKIDDELEDIEEEETDSDLNENFQENLNGDENDDEESVDSLEGSENSNNENNKNNTNDNNNNNNNNNRNNTDENEFEGSLRPKLPIGMSLKAKGKLPIDAPLTKTWPGFQALNIILHSVSIIKSEIPNIQQSSRTEVLENLIRIEKIENFSPKISKFASSQFLSKTKFEQLKFVWSTLSLGWYESILWGVIFTDNNIAPDKNSSSLPWFTKRNSAISIKEVAYDWGFSWGRSNSNKSSQLETFQFDDTILQFNIWNGSMIKLFKIKRPITEKPLVDVNNLMKKFRLSTSSLNTLDSKATNNSSLNSPSRNSISALNSPNQLTPINSRQSFNTPRNSIHINLSRQNSYA